MNNWISRQWDRFVDWVDADVRREYALYGIVAGILLVSVLALVF